MGFNSAFKGLNCVYIFLADPVFNTCNLTNTIGMTRLEVVVNVYRVLTIEEIQENATRKLHAITESAVQEAWQQWRKCW